MRFDKLTVLALRGYRAPFEIDLGTPGLVIVEADNRDGGGVWDSNGSGKSMALVEAPLWCLFGKMSRHGNVAVGDQIVHPIRGADVALSLWAGDQQIGIRRMRTPKGQGKVQVTAPVSRDPSRRADDVAAILGLDYRAFCAAVVITGEDALAGASFKEQMEVLEAVLRLDELSEASAKRAAEATALERQLAGAVVETRAAMRAVEAAQEVLRNLKDSEAAALLVEQAATLRRTIQEAEEARARLPDLAAVVEEQWARVRRCQSKKDEVLAEQAGIARRQAEVSRQAAASDTCQTCQRPFNNAEEIARSRRAALDTLKALKEELEALGPKHVNAERDLRAADVKRQAVEEEYARLKDPLDRLPQMQDLLAQAEAAVAGHAEQVRLAEEALARETAGHQRAIETEADLTRRAWKKRFWAVAFGRDKLQADIFQAGVPVLDEAGERYSTLLTGGTIRVAFNPLRESQTEGLIRISGASAPTYKGLSGGEKQRVNLIVALSIRALARWRLPEPINFSVYDETFDKIDAAGLAIVAQILQQEAETGTVFVVTHNPALKRLFPTARILQVIREGGEAILQGSD